MISLIVSTLGRTEELTRLLASLRLQDPRDFEVLLVDQNQNDRLLPLLSSFKDLPIRHLRSQRGLSRGRNCGLANISGEVVAFPDDDCWYPPGLLASVTRFFAEHSQYDALLTAIHDEDDRWQGSRRRLKQPCECDTTSIWDYGISINCFLSRRLVDAVGKFDEQAGAGAETIYQSGEETDYFLRAFDEGCRFFFDPALTVYHPDQREIDRMLRQAYPYGAGTGYVLRKHGYSHFDLWKTYLARSFGGAAVAALRGDLGVAKVRWLRGAGQWSGYRRAPYDLRKQPSPLALEGQSH